MTDTGIARDEPHLLADETQPKQRPCLVSAHLADPRLGQFGSLIGRSLIWAMRNTHR